MNPETNRVLSLREMGLEVEAEGREWMRRRLAEKLQAQADRHGGVFLPRRPADVVHRRKRGMQLRSVAE